MGHACQGAELREALFSGSEADMVTTSLVLSISLAMCLLDVSQPLAAPLHVICLTIDAMCSWMSILNIVFSHDITSIFLPVHDKNLNAAVKANIELILISRLTWAGTMWLLASSLGADRFAQVGRADLFANTTASIARLAPRRSASVELPATPLSPMAASPSRLHDEQCSM